MPRQEPWSQDSKVLASLIQQMKDVDAGSNWHTDDLFREMINED
jgi:hypothetical protein